MTDKKETLNLYDVGYVKLVTVGSINPNNPVSEESKKQQLDILNQCLNDFPKGKIIGIDRSIGRYQVGEHELTMEKLTYHIGFRRRPLWDTDNN